MLELIDNKDTQWMPSKLSDIEKYLLKVSFVEEMETEWLVIFRMEPYIDSVFVHYAPNNYDKPDLIKRFVFHEDFSWDYDDEKFFETRCLNNSRCGLSYEVLDPIFKIYSSKYPDWKLKRYYTKPFKMLDHIYNCMRKNTAKEMLYKAELDELAANISDIDELNLLSSRPTDIYEGISMRTLRALNCRDGSRLLSTSYNRAFIKELQRKFPETFEKNVNDAQCRYLNRLIAGSLTVGEAGRLFRERRKYLMNVWNHSQYEMFIHKVKNLEEAEALRKIDPYYNRYVMNNRTYTSERESELSSLIYYLLHNREEYDKKIRRSNRKRNDEWQERSNGYVVRYPQTINDFCREAVYMSNCLLTYVDATINNDTTILFIRRCDDVNTPFITMEIYKNELMQAYHRFNDDCSTEEAEWIMNYCKRHNIGHKKFKFNSNEGELY